MKLNAVRGRKSGRGRGRKLVDRSSLRLRGKRRSKRCVKPQPPMLQSSVRHHHLCQATARHHHLSPRTKLVKRHHPYPAIGKYGKHHHRCQPNKRDGNRHPLLHNETRLLLFQLQPAPIPSVLPVVSSPLRQHLRLTLRLVPFVAASSILTGLSFVSYFILSTLTVGYRSTKWCVRKQRPRSARLLTSRSSGLSVGSALIVRFTSISSVRD